MTSHPPLWRSLPALILLIGVLIFLGGLVSYFSPPVTSSPIMLKTSLTERDIAIYRALERGQKEYSFTTNFVPGLGYINDPAAYRQTWENQVKEQLLR